MVQRFLERASGMYERGEGVYYRPSRGLLADLVRACFASSEVIGVEDSAFGGGEVRGRNSRFPRETGPKHQHDPSMEVTNS